MKALGHHAQAVLVEHGNVAIAHADASRLGPGVDAGGHGDPDAVARVAQHKVDLAYGLAVNAVKQGAGLTLAGHDFEQVGAKVGNQNIAVARKGQAVGERALGEFGLKVFAALGSGLGKARIGLLANELLRAVGGNAHDATARVGGPQGAVALGQDAFRALQVLADVANLRAVHGETVQGVGQGHGSNTRLKEGKATSRASTANMVSVKGAVPRKISPSEMSTELPSVLLMT